MNEVYLWNWENFRLTFNCSSTEESCQIFNNLALSSLQPLDLMSDVYLGKRYSCFNFYSRKVESNILATSLCFLSLWKEIAWNITKNILSICFHIQRENADLFVWFQGISFVLFWTCFWNHCSSICLESLIILLVSYFKKNSLLLFFGHSLWHWP